MMGEMICKAHGTVDCLMCAYITGEERGYKRGLAERDAEIARLRSGVKRLEDMACIPAAEYVPGLGDIIREAQNILSASPAPSEHTELCDDPQCLACAARQTRIESPAPSEKTSEGAQQMKVCPHGKVPGLSAECVECRADWDKRSENWERFKKTSEALLVPADNGAGRVPSRQTGAPQESGALRGECPGPGCGNTSLMHAPDVCPIMQAKWRDAFGDNPPGTLRCDYERTVAELLLAHGEHPEAALVEALAALLARVADEARNK